MSILYKSSVIFINFEDMLCDTDSYVCNQVYKANDSLKTNMFNKLIETIERPEVGVDNIKFLVMTKQTDCFLREYVSNDYLGDDIDIIDNNDDKITNIPIIVSSMYNEILYNDKVTKIDNDITFTNLSNSIEYLITDPNFQKMYVYMPSCTQAIHELIYNHFSRIKDKITIVTGDMESFLQTTPCDVYIIKDIDLVPCLFFDREEDAQIIVPAFPCNMDSNGICLKYSGEWENELKKYKLELNIIQTPI